ncbi:hypothetical protein MLD38_002116 [Melastoma candidum]|uniref:Uncharacterized protein n=1 Tax=Melastoma candidum TaxID=119954 RepID=A0ACB9SFC3_9MYRT|nr:hypothetical protein MLD38_002116 [Melastoma candidum]
MKLRCDVCEESDATVFCSADEAALCTDCDGRVHRANKLASRHQRFSLMLPLDQDAPPCDTCRERRAFMFCQQDRAVLCGECDLSTHASNKHAKQHDRFVITGLILSNFLQSFNISGDEPLSNGYEFDVVPDFNSKAVPEGTVLDQSKSNATDTISPSSSAGAAAESVDATVVVVMESSREGDVLASGSSLSEYLMEALSGWQVDELLESCPDSSGTFKNGDGDDSIDPLDMGICNLHWSGATAEGLGFWVPQAAPPVLYPTRAVEESLLNPSRGTDVVMGTRNHCHKRWSDEGLTVPRIGPAVAASFKRKRTTTLY